MPKKITILAIDDEQDILYTLAAIGTAVGWKVYTENNSLAAAAQVAALKPDLILLDYHMPQQNGVVTVRKIREINNRVPIIVLTIDGRQELADEFLEAGANDFSTKPIKVPDLVARINVHLRLLEKQREAEGRTIVSKGINDTTLELVRSYCQLQQDWFYVEDAARELGLAYQTTSRYLQFLHAQGDVQVENDYGKVGRPRNRYRKL